jgi:Penicillinase repressor/Carboxypeptidase regulatory-like domain/AhpC/TSA family
MGEAEKVGPSRRERQGMDVVYQFGRATAAEIRAGMPDPPGYSAVRPVLRVLQEKGHLKHGQNGPRCVYRPTVPREKARRSALKPARLIGLIMLAAVTVPASAVRLYARQGPGDGEPPKGQEIVMPGRVVAREGDRPVAQAEVVAQIGTVRQTTHTDASGHFAVHIPADLRSDPRAWLSVTVRHPDFIAKTGGGGTLAEVIAGRSRGEPAFFDTIRLDPGVEYTGEVVGPDGSPAAGLDLWFQNWGWTNYPREEHFSAENKVRTDARGRFRLRMWKTKSIEINATPADFAPLQQFIGFDGPSNERPDYSVPADLGTFVLEDGIRAIGCLVDRNGRPMPGARIEIQGRIRIFARRTASTGADGSFAFGPLRPGSYTVQAEGQGAGGGIDPSLPPLPPPPRAIKPVKVVLESGRPTAPIGLSEAETVTVTCRCVDSQGRPAHGAPVSLWGLIPNAEGKADPFEVAGAGMTRASSVNQPEPKDVSTRLDWGVQGVPDSEGKVVFHAPKGLRNATLTTFPFDEGTSIKTRLREDQGLKFWGGGRLGDLVEDVPGVTFVYYRAPVVVATIEAEGGELPEHLEVGESFIGPNGGSFGGRFKRQADGRYRSQSLMPDHVYDITAGAPGWLWTKVGGVSLPEGGYKEVSLLLRKKPEPLRIGDFAPDVGIKRLDGKPLRLADYRGKFVLLDIWQIWGGPDDGDLPSLKRAQSRFGKHPQFALIGVSGGPRRADAEKLAAQKGIDWLRAVLEYETGDSPIPSLYGADRQSSVVLIGPDGRILAMGLHGPAIDLAVAKALGQ